MFFYGLGLTGWTAPWPRFIAITSCILASAGTNGVWPGGDIPHAPNLSDRVSPGGWRTRRVARRDTMQSRVPVVKWIPFRAQIETAPGCLHTFDSKANLSPHVLRLRRALFCFIRLAQTFVPLLDSRGKDEPVGKEVRTRR